MLVPAAPPPSCLTATPNVFFSQIGHVTGPLYARMCSKTWTPLPDHFIDKHMVEMEWNGQRWDPAMHDMEMEFFDQG